MAADALEWDVVRRLLPVIAGSALVVLSGCGGSGSADTTTADVGFDGVGDVPPTLLASVADTVEAVPSTVEPGGSAVGAFADGNRVLVLGDSIMESTTVRYGAAMCSELVPNGWAVDIVAENGQHVEYGVAALDERLDEGWDAAVVMLGSNYGGDQTAYEQQLDEIVSRLAPRPTVLLTVTEFTESRQDVNESIRRVADRYDNTLVIDWAAETAADPSLLGDDGLHLSEDGKLRITGLIADTMGTAPDGSVGDCLDPDPFEPPPPATTTPPTSIDLFPEEFG